jgi:hypothetical protein
MEGKLIKHNVAGETANRVWIRGHEDHPRSVMLERDLDRLLVGVREFDLFNIKYFAQRSEVNPGVFGGFLRLPL